MVLKRHILDHFTLRAYSGAEIANFILAHYDIEEM